MDFGKRQKGHTPAVASSLEARVRHLQATFEDFSENLQFAWDYVSSDAPSSLTKLRLIMETVLARVYQVEMGRDPKKPLLGDMLVDNQFTRKIGRRIIVRMNSIREMGNLGAHGLTVAPDDAIRGLEDLCTVLEWYRARYVKAAPAPTAGAASAAAPTNEGPAAKLSVRLQAILSFRTTTGEETEITINPEQSVVAGRLAGLEMVFDCPTVSKRHAEFRLGEQGLAVCDLDSKNHVFVNGELVTRTLLNRGDKVHLSSSGPIITVMEAPIVWPQTTSDVVRAKQQLPQAAAVRNTPPPGPPIADPTEVEQSAQEALARALVDRR